MDNRKIYIVKNSAPPNKDHPQARAYLKGFAIALIIAIAIFMYTENFVIALAAYVSVGTALGVALAEKSQPNKQPPSPAFKKVLVILLLLGILAYLAFLAIELI